MEGNAVMKTRNKTAKPAAFGPTDIKPVTGVGGSSVGIPWVTGTTTPWLESFVPTASQVEVFGRRKPGAGVNYRGGLA